MNTDCTQAEHARASHVHCLPKHTLAIPKTEKVIAAEAAAALGRSRSEE